MALRAARGESWPRKLAEEEGDGSSAVILSCQGGMEGNKGGLQRDAKQWRGKSWSENLKCSF